MLDKHILFQIIIVILTQIIFNTLYTVNISNAQKWISKTASQSIIHLL